MPYKSWNKPISRRLFNPNFEGPKKRGRKKKGDCCCFAAFPIILSIMSGIAVLIWFLF
jgi:hypothetical protein